MRIIIIVTVLLLCSCKEEGNHQKINKEEVESKHFKKQSKGDSIEKIVLLENGFDQDTVQIVIGQQTLFNGVLSTDPRSGSAKALEIKSLDSSKFLDFKMNGWHKKIALRDSLFLHINKIGKDSIEIIYNEKFGGYY